MDATVIAALIAACASLVSAAIAAKSAREQINTAQASLLLVIGY